MNRASRALWSLAILVVAGLVAFVVIWQLQSTSEGTAVVDRSLMTDIPCAVPCWQGIVPGTTSSTHALEILKNSPFVREETIRWGEVDSSGRATWSYDLAKFYGENAITWEDGIVQTIGLLVAYELPLSDVIDKFGPPDALMANWCPLQQPCWDINLFYSQIGMCIGGPVDIENPQIEPSLLMEGVSLYAPQTVEEFLGYRYRYQNPEEAEQSLALDRESLRPWQGYGGLFALYYESPQDLHY